jgi:hypothetical protein
MVQLRVFDAVGPSAITSVTAGWDRVGLVEGSAHLAGDHFANTLSVWDARPQGWLSRFVYQPQQDSEAPVEQYAMEWDWPSRLIRWVEVMPDGALRACRPTQDNGGHRRRSR